MKNNFALLLIAGILVTVIAVGQAAHISPTGRLRDGFRLLLKQALLGVVGGLLLASNAVSNSIWMLETAKNLLQAVLLSGAGLAAYVLANPTDAERLATPANITGFIVFGVLMALVTRRVEQLRDAQAQADEARRRSELAALLAAALKKD